MWVLELDNTARWELATLTGLAGSHLATLADIATRYLATQVDTVTRYLALLADIATWYLATLVGTVTRIELKINRAGVPILVVQQLVANAEVTSSRVNQCS